MEKAVLWSAVAQWLKPLQRGGADADRAGLAALVEGVNLASDIKLLRGRDRATTTAHNENDS